jgi:hypothetical protein
VTCLLRPPSGDTWCGAGASGVLLAYKATCSACLRKYASSLIQDAVHVLAQVNEADEIRYGIRYQAPRHPCGCRSVGECIHSNGPTPREEKLALNRLVDAFASSLRAKLHRKVDEGNGGWDSEEWGVQDIVGALLTHIGKGDPVDVAAFAVFWWNRWVERKVPCAVGEGCDCDGWHRVDENPRAALPVGQRRARVARRKSATRRK